MDPADLLNAAQAGDRQAFDDLVRRQARRLFGITRRVTGDASLAEDAVQETFVRVLEGRATLRRKAAMDSWLARVATRVAIDLLRRRESRRKREEAHAMGRAPSARPEERALRTEESEILGKALDALPADVRAAIWLHVVEGEGLREVAECLGLPRSTVGRRVQLGLARLRQTLLRAGVVIPVGTALGSLLRDLPGAEPSPGLLARLEKIALPESSAATATLPGGGRRTNGAADRAAPGRILRPKTIALACAGAVLAAVVWILDPLAWRVPPDGGGIPVAVREPVADAPSKETPLDSPVRVEVGAPGEPRTTVAIRGRVVDGAFAPAPGASVVAHVDLAQRDVHEMLDQWGFVDIVLDLLGGPKPLALTTAGEDGTFTLEIPEPRDVVLHAFTSTEGEASSGMSHVLAAALGEEVEVRLVPAHRIRGIVHDASGAPLEGAMAVVIPDPIMPFDRDFTSYDLQRLLDAFLPISAGTDGAGSFALPPLPTIEPHRLLAIGRGRTAGHALAPRDGAPLDVRLLDAVEIEGRVVVGPRGVPGSGARVIALGGGSEGSEEAGWFATDVADGEGRFILGVPERSRFRAWAKVPGHLQPGMASREESGADGPFLIEVGRGGAIRGRVGFARTGEPAPGVRVLARDLAGALSSAQAISDAAGRYRLEGLPLARRHEILVVLPGYVPRNRIGALSSEEQPEVEHDIALVPTAVVRGKVVRPDGTGVPDATVETVVSVEKPEEGMALRWRREILEQGASTTGPDGEFVDEDVVPAGKVYAWAYHPELGESFTGPLVFRGAEPRVAEAVVKLDGAGIEVRVRNVKGDPIPGVSVDLTSSIVWDAMPEGMNLGEWYQQLTSVDVSRLRRERGVFPGRRKGVTDVNGLSRWTDLMSDSYQLSIDRSLSRPDVPNFEQEYWLYMGTTKPLEPLRVAVIEMPLDLGRRFSGTVVDANGSGEEGLRVQLWFRAEFSGLDGAYGYSVTHTRAGGKFLAEGMGPGPYDIWVKREGGPMLKMRGIEEGSVDFKITYAPEGRKEE